MKTKTFLLLCLFLGIGLTQLTAQNGTNGTGTAAFWTPFDYYIPVFSSDGDQIDWLEGYANVHVVLHFKNGATVKAPQQFHCEAVSVGFLDENGKLVGGTGEIFEIHEEYQVDLTTGLPLIGYGHTNAIGNRGSHYIIFYSSFFDGTAETIMFVKALSPGNK